MYDAFSRMEILMGTRAVNRLGSAKIAVFGIGGAGSYVVEALARCGVGSLTLVDHKDIVQSDINRQLYAGQSTVGRKKVQTAKEHIRDIDENILVHTYETYYNEETAGMFDLQSFDYIGGCHGCIGIQSAPDRAGGKLPRPGDLLSCNR